MSTQTSEGRRFSEVYLSGGEPLPDSKRMRARICASAVRLDLASLLSLFRKEIGVAFDLVGSGVEETWYPRFAKLELREFLDFITVFHQHLGRRGSGPGQQRQWVVEVNRVFSSEHVRYKVDEKGGVHFAVDAEFERGRAAVIAALGSDRYANVLASFEAAYRDLDDIPPNGKLAIRHVFAAAEGLFRLMFSTSILGESEVSKHLTSIIDRLFADTTSRGASHRLATAFGKWIVAAHQYRHEPGTEEVAQPPLSLAIAMVGQGAALIRWLADLDQLSRKRP